MPEFAFHGFNPGSTVALSAVQGGDSSSNSVSNWGQNLASLSIIRRGSTTSVAPASVYLEAIEILGFSVPGGPGPGEVYDPAFHEITYIWTVRGAPLAFTNSLNLPNAWKDANVYYGKEVTIAFNDPGTYDVDLWAVDRDGNTATSTHRVVVASADTAHPGTDTICYSQTDFIGAPSGATQVSSLSALNNALASKGASADVRVLFRGGQLIDLGGSITGQSVNRMAVGSFGDGGRAELVLPPADNGSAIFGAPSSELKIYDLNLTGGWDASKEQGVIGAPPVSPECAIDQLVHRVTLTGADMLSTCRLAGNAFYTLSDSYITNWRGFGFYIFGDEGGTKYYGVVGSSVRQHDEALQGGSINSGNNLGPLRSEYAKHLTISACDFFTRNGWSGGAVGTADQPCMRFNASTQDGVHTNVDRVVCEGGYQIVKMKGEDTARQELPGNYVFDKFLTIGSPETLLHIDCHFGGVTLRNRYAFEPNVPKLSWSGIMFDRFDIDDDQIQAINQNSPITIYNSTYLSLLTTANLEYQGAGIPNLTPIVNSGEFNNFTFENNLIHLPNQNAPVNNTPLDAASFMSEIDLFFKGRRESLPVVSVTSPGVAHNGTMVIPYSLLLDKDGSTTSLSYWQNAAAAGDNMHLLFDQGSWTRYYAQLVHFTVTPDIGGLTITNQSGNTWQGGATLEFKLDHSSQGNALDPTFDATGHSVPTAAALSSQPASAGLIAEDAFSAAARPGSRIPGAPSGQPSMGAIETV